MCGERDKSLECRFFEMKKPIVENEVAREPGVRQDLPRNRTEQLDRKPASHRDGQTALGFAEAQYEARPIAL